MYLSFDYNSTDTDAELGLVCEQAKLAGALEAVPCSHWAEGGAGAVALGQAVQRAAETPHQINFLYDLEVKSSHYQLWRRGKLPLDVDLGSVLAFSRPCICTIGNIHPGLPHYRCDAVGKLQKCISPS